jgi:molecular chaperone Hsp33
MLEAGATLPRHPPTTMPDDFEKETTNEPIEVRCHFVRERNALLVRADFSAIYTDFYLHLMQHGIRLDRPQGDLLKDGLAAMTLHLASRPWNEAIAWTLSWQDPPMNAFVTGSNRLGNVVGRLFTEDVRQRERNIFVSQVTVSGQEPRQSLIEAGTLDFFALAEDYYRQSEQRPGRYFRLDDDGAALLSAQPGCDLGWFESLDGEAMREIDGAETLSLLELRSYRFDCGCGPERIYPIVSGMSDATLESVFDGGEVLAAGCPRCGARYSITREGLEAFRRDHAE